MAFEDIERAQDGADGDPALLIQNAPMTGFQIRLIVILFLLYALDGFDALAIAFALPGIRQDWSVGPAELGIAISMGLLGTGIGSLFIAPLSDRAGRRPLIVFCLAAMTAGMLLCAVASDMTVLIVGRFVTGLGVGGLLPAVSALTAEYSNLRRRNFAVAMVSVGFPAGGFFGGMVATLLLAHYDWRAVFWFGGIVTGIMLLVSLRGMPESLEFLAVRRPANALDRVNAILGRLGHASMNLLAARPAAIAQSSLLDIFRPALIVTTLTITLTYAFHNASFYYSVNWLPKIAIDFGFSAPQAAAVSAWLSGGGVAGALVVAWLAARVEIRFLTLGTLAASALFLAVLTRTGSNDTAFIALALCLGVCLYGGQVSLYALMMKSFPTQVRATGAGFVTGVGRMGGILSPTISGYLFAAGMNNIQVSTAMALGSFIGVLALLVGMVTGRGAAR